MLTYSQELAGEKTKVALNEHNWRSNIHYQTYYYRDWAVRVKSDVLTQLKEVDLPTIFHRFV